jgi:hypothetical protein
MAKTSSMFHLPQSSSGQNYYKFEKPVVIYSDILLFNLPFCVYAFLVAHE